ncbi:inositol 1,4,5-triphosphate receptor associated 2 isoform X1 [Petromyzon marinus]|uniref:inositol 1,4,5-triphosphate receptor associated 2 isoform X1 n=1 Tax=Petromyzon marinus TaxID=7757 RepID=UPI003F6FC88E
MSGLSKESQIAKRHNPVESIRRKINTINLREHGSNPITHIPKYQSRNYECQGGSVRRNLESLLRMQGTPVINPNYTQRHNYQHYQWNDESHPTGDLIIFSSPNVPVETNTSSRRFDGTMHVMDSKMVQLPKRQGCSTPVVDEEDNDTAGVDRPAVCQRSQSVKSPTVRGLCKGILRPEPDHLEACSPVASLDGSYFSPENPAKSESLDGSSEDSVVSSEIGFISEENLLNTIFKTCDTESTGHVAVAKIIEFVQLTISCGSEDSGLQELHTMLDPERRDLSIDMDTYQAIMCEWIEHRRTKADDVETQDELKPVDVPEFVLAEPSQKASMLSITVGSLEALGGDISRMDLETSDLISCIADLQHTHMRLLEDNMKLKGSREMADELNAKLVEQIDTLSMQLRSSQVLLQRDESLKDEIEELKRSLAKVEEEHAHTNVLNKQLKKDNLQLTSNMTTLQDEVVKLRSENDFLCKQEIESGITMEDIKKQLQELEAVAAERNNLLFEQRNNHLKEMMETVSEYNCIIESLRAGKSCLEAQNLDLQEKVAMHTKNNCESPDLSQTILMCNSIDMEITQAEKICRLQNNMINSHADILHVKTRLSETGTDMVGKSACQVEAVQATTTQAEQAVSTQTDGDLGKETATREHSTFLVDMSSNLTSCSGSSADAMELPSVPNVILDNMSLYSTPLHSQQIHDGVRDVKPCNKIFRVIVPAFLLMLTTLGLIGAITTFPHTFVPTVEHDSAYASVETLIWPYTDFQYVRRPPI